MGIFNKRKFMSEEDKKAEKQKLMSLDEKELLIEILLQLQEINSKCDDIQRKQILFGN